MRALIVTQALFLVALAWCVSIYHGASAQDAGISYYGVTHRTIVIAVVGYLIAAVGLWRVSVTFRDGGLDPLLWLGLRVVAAMLPLLLLTPYNHGALLNWSHMTVGVLGALVQIAISFALVRRRATGGPVAGFVVQIMGGVLGAFSLPDWRFQALLYGEIIFQIGFGWCLLEWTRELPRPR